MFRPAINPTLVARCEKPDWVKEASEGSRRRGVLFERRVLTALKEKYEDSIEISPWFCFWEDKELRYCSPDAILHLPHYKVVLEIKRGHTEKAYFQLHELYIPVLKAFFGEEAIRACEIVRWYDPRLHFPHPIELISQPEKAPKRGTGVHIYNELIGL